MREGGIFAYFDVVEQTMRETYYLSIDISLVSFLFGALAMPLRMLWWKAIVLVLLAAAVASFFSV
jgi:hypothetical protein